MVVTGQLVSYAPPTARVLRSCKFVRLYNVLVGSGGLIVFTRFFEPFATLESFKPTTPDLGSLVEIFPGFGVP